ncbi:MAG TPA: hypothetical protein VFF52_08115 [Isosphaeraceae bacterium]|nr:hypothetical protein [Isosphaeraceae bacterium]
MIPIRFPDLDTKNRALARLGGRYSVKNCRQDELHVPADTLADLATAGLDFQVMSAAVPRQELGGPVISRQVSSSAPASSCLVRISSGQDGQVTAELLGAPDIHATAPSQEEAVERLQRLLQQQVNLGSLVAVEIPQQHPLAKWAGYLKDDPDFDDYVEEIRKFREEMDRREGYVPDTDECSNTSSTPTT